MRITMGRVHNLTMKINTEERFLLRRRARRLNRSHASIARSGFDKAIAAERAHAEAEKRRTATE